MKKDMIFNHYYSMVRKYGLVSLSGARLRYNLNNLFQGVSFEGKRMLDVGAGSGLFSLYGACMGAKTVVALEPQSEGSIKGSSDKLEALKAIFKNIQVERVTFQEFDAGGDMFDIILLHNSINHLDEEACIALQYSEDARNSYRLIFKKLGKIAAPGARLILCDCSKCNLFASLKIRNPLVPTIEWHKHQPPEVWRDMLLEYGFGKAKISWIPFGISGNLGKVIGYFTISHFCLDMEKE